MTKQAGNDRKRPRLRAARRGRDHDDRRHFRIAALEGCTDGLPELHLGKLPAWGSRRHGTARELGYPRYHRR